MRILLLTHTFNSLTQRLGAELRQHWHGHRHGRVKASTEDIIKALTGNWRDEQAGNARRHR